MIANNIVDDAAMGISVTNFNEGGRLAVVQGNLIRNVFFRKDARRPHRVRRVTGIELSVRHHDRLAGNALITDNLITGAKDGAIRAMNGATPTGPDLATASAAAYRNLASIPTSRARPQNESGKN